VFPHDHPSRHERSLPAEKPQGDQSAKRNAEPNDDSLFQLISELYRTREYAMHILSRMDTLISAIESLPQAKPAPAESAPAAADIQQLGARRKLLAFLRESRPQVVLGLLVGLTALLIAFYLFARSR
jgi:hypothetical protein